MALKDTVLGKNKKPDGIVPNEDVDRLKIAEKFGIIPQETKSGVDLTSELYTTASMLDSPRSMQQVFKNINALPDTIPQTRVKFFEDSKSELSKIAKDIQDKYDKDAKATEWAQVAETLGQALTQYAAASEGLRTGVDITSGLKFKPTDWNAKQTLLLDKLKQQVGEIGRKEDKLERQESEEVGRFERERGRIANAQLRRLFEEIAAGRREQTGKEADAEKIEKAARKTIDNWSKQQDRFNQEIQQAASRFAKIEELKDTLDEEKYNSKIEGEIAATAKRTGVPADRLRSVWETIKAEELEDVETAPQTMSQWLSSTGDRTTKFPTKAIPLIRAYVGEKTTPEEQQQIEDILMRDFSIKLPK